MKRLTYWNQEYDCWSYSGPSGEAAKRLAAYEDTGLEPETVNDLLGRFHGLCEIFDDLDLVDRVHFQAFLERVRRWNWAEKDGRLVVLPCKVGDTIYNIFYGKIIETKVRTFFFGHPSHNVEKRNLRMIRTDRWDIPMCNLGKTVFLTREEAEAAPKKREDEL